MIRLNLLILISSVLIAGCTKDSNPVSGNGPPPPAVVIDTMKFNAIVKSDTNGYLSTHILYRIVYHFEELSGSLDFLSLTSDGYGDLYEATPIITPVGVQQTIGSEFVGGDALVGHDSLLVHIILSGHFWTHADTAYSVFSVTDSVRVWIQR
jgi:hypothetical protein